MILGRELTEAQERCKRLENDLRESHELIDALRAQLKAALIKTRDQFAMAARDEDLVCDSAWATEPKGRDWMRVRAEARYRFADEMTRVREVKP